METKTQFFNACDECFGFLRSFGFQAKANKVEAGTFIKIYQNETTAVEVSLEWMEQYLYVRLCQLVAGKIKENPTIIKQDTKLYCFNLENLLLLTDPALIVKPDTNQELTFSQLEKTLCHYAGAVEKYAFGVLNGNFEVFPQLERVVKERAAQSSQGYADRQVIV